MNLKAVGFSFSSCVLCVKLPPITFFFFGSSRIGRKISSDDLGNGRVYKYSSSVTGSCTGTFEKKQISQQQRSPK